MNDLISRQAAIDALEREKTYSRAYNEGYTQTDPFEQYNMGLIDGIKALKRLPSAQPERKKGEWVLQSDDYHEYYECDQCGIAVGLDDVRNFCPNCGADMREGGAG